jgi:hypothetical protein
LQDQGAPGNDANQQQSETGPAAGKR